ncbi:uncharacterized protein LOC143024521 [Oratosquilla oratoria]|uniref:uncharacterized protein LOC143024521 n=1 Tax=Oratosquilla oratoria TaxID=337810 RepID=UPI003F7775E8
MTDHQPLTEALKGKTLQGNIARWQTTILKFNQEIAYIKGKANVVANTLSRNPMFATVPTTHCHPSRDRCFANTTCEYFWPKIVTDITRHIENCTTCSKLRGTDPRPLQIGEVPIPSEPWDTMGIDLLKLPPIHQCSHYVLAAVDYFSKYTRKLTSAIKRLINPDQNQERQLTGDSGSRRIYTM